MDGLWESRNRRDRKECFQPTLLGLSKYYGSLVKPIIRETLSFNRTTFSKVTTTYQNMDMKYIVLVITIGANYIIENRLHNC